MLAKILVWLLQQFHRLIVVVPTPAEKVISALESLFLHSRMGDNPKTWPFLFRRLWQFDLERAFHRRGKARVVDPLFDASISVFHSREPEYAGKPAGFCWGSVRAEGLVIYGRVRGTGNRRVNVIVNGTIIRNSTVVGKRDLRIRILRPALMQFPKGSLVVIRSEDGAPLSYWGGKGFRFALPAGTGGILELARSGILVNKKGSINQTPEKIKARQDAYLSLYTEARRFFEEEIGKNLFLMYGTLLGVYRGGDFIPGDDDFDCGYVSDETDPLLVKEETKRIVTKLVQGGFTVSFNRRGRLFRLQRERGAADGTYLDLRPLWFDAGHMLAHKQAFIPAAQTDFLPVKTTKLRGVEVDIPADPEVLLREYYGPGWRIPDPGYVNDVSRIPAFVLQQLTRAYITPKEYWAMDSHLQSAEGMRPGMGRFVADALQNLYPLEDVIEEQD